MIQRLKRRKNLRLVCLFIALVMVGAWAFSAKEALAGVEGKFWYIGFPDEIGALEGQAVRMTPHHTRTFKNINFPLTGGSFTHSDGTSVPFSDDFYANFSAFLLAPETGTYTFHVQVDDGFVLGINNSQLSARTTPAGFIQYDANFPLEKSKFYKIYLKYFEDRGAAGLQLAWTTPSGKTEIIPAEQLFTSIPGPSLVKPVQGANRNVNLPVDESVTFEVSSTLLDIRDYEWQVVRAGLQPEDAGWQRSRENRKKFQFSEATEFTLFVRVRDVKDLVSSPLAIPARAWNRPLIVSTPDATPSWHADSGIFYGLKNQVIPLKAKEDLNGNEQVLKFVWFDQEGKTVAEQRPGPGLAGEFFSFPSTLPPNIDDISRHIRDKNLAPNFSALFETINFPGGFGTMKHGSQRDKNGNLIDTGLVDYFFGRFTGALDIKTAGAYKFHVASDDGFRLKVNNQSIAEYTTGRGMSETEGSYTFNSAGLYPIELTYFEHSGGQGLELRWTKPGGSKAIIPKEAFASAAAYLPTSSNLNGSLKVKAVTNFGIESEAKTYKVKVYDQLQLNPGGPYTGRPKVKPVILNGSINTNAYPGAEIKYEWRSKADNKPIASGDSPRAEFTGEQFGIVPIEFIATVTTQEGLVIKSRAETTVQFEAGVPTAMPNGPYRGGIDSGNFSPIAFQGNDPNFIEAEDIGKIDRWRWQLEPANKALNFEDNAYVKLDKAVALGGDWTLSGWFKYPLPKTTNFNTLVKGGTNQDHHILVKDGNKLGGWVSGNFRDSGYEFPKDLASGWHHVAAVGSGNNTIFYIDGLIVGSIPFKTQANISFIGNHEGDLQAFGAVDEVAVFTKALDAKEVNDLFHSRPITAKENGLAAYWKFDEGSGNTVADASGNGNMAILVNNPKWVDSEVFATSANATTFNPTFAYELAGRYPVRLKVRGETGKWSPIRATTVTVLDGKIQGQVKAADLRTPVEGVRLTMTSSHIAKETLARKARASESVLTLDGLDDSVEISGIKLANQSFSFTLWAKRERSGAEEWLLSQGIASANSGLKVGFLKGNLFSFSFFNNDLVTPVAYLEADWHFWAGSYNAKTKERRLYRDGKEVAKDIAIDGYQGSGLLFLGGDFQSKGFFKGAMDEVAIFNRVLNPAEISNIYANRAPIGEGGLVGLWNFDEAIDTLARDVSGNKNNGELKGAIIDPIGLIQLLTNQAGDIFTATDRAGFYSFEKLPLGSYRLTASKFDAGTEHEFEKKIIATELTLDAPSQLAIDYVDLSVFPVSGRIVYSLQKQGQYVFVDNTVVKATPIGSTSDIESFPSAKSPDAVGSNYNLPLFQGKYLFKAEGMGHDVRINEKSPGFDPATQLVTIKTATTGIDFIDYTTRKITVNVEDSGGNPIELYQKNKIKVQVNGENGFAEGEVKTEGTTTFFQAIVNPGKYTITLANVPEAISKENKTKKEAEVDVTVLPEASTTMIVPVPIELEIGPEPKLINLPTHVLDSIGLKDEDIPRGFMCFMPDPNETQSHTYTIKPTANGFKVDDITLKVVDNISQTDYTPASEKTYTGADERYKVVEEAEVKVGKYIVSAGIPVMTAVNEADPNSYIEFKLPGGKTVKVPKPLPKTITFRASKEGYKDSQLYTLYVTTLGDVPEGTAAEIIAVPNVNYLVLHDPPGDGSFSSFDDSLRLSGIVDKLRIKNKIGDKEIAVYPSPWSVERRIIEEGLELDFSEIFTKVVERPLSVNLDVLLKEVNFSKVKDKEKDLGDRGILKPKDRFSAPAAFGVAAGFEVVKSAVIVAAIPIVGPAALALHLLNLGVTIGLITNQVGLVQYEISPNRHFETPSGDAIPDIMGPGKGDVYYGEGWTLGLQSKFRLRIKKNDKAFKDKDAPNYDPNDLTKSKWLPATEQILTYAVLDRSNQYAYTIRDIEKIVADLELQVAGAAPEQKTKLEEAKKTWEKLLNKNPAYVWQKEHVEKGEKADSKELQSFLKSEFSDQKGELLIFSGGQSYEYSRSISESAKSTFSTGVAFSTEAIAAGKFGVNIELWTGQFGGVDTGEIGFEIAGELHMTNEQALGVDLESGVAAEQSVGFTLNDDDVGDNISTYAYEGPWGTPIFFTEPGSVTSDPWQNGTNKAVDFKLELVNQPTKVGPFDYHDGAQYKVRLSYSGKRKLEASGVGFVAYAPPADNPDNLSVKFNGADTPFSVEISKQSPVATLAVSLTPPEIDMQNSEEKEYEVVIQADEEADGQVSSALTLKPRFADLKAPRATITAPYDGQRLSPSVFTDKNPFLVQVFSDDEDVARIQLQIRAKKTDGVWEPWRNLDGLIWEDENVYPTAKNENVTIVTHIDRSPPRKEFTFTWSGAKINALGVGEYALRAVASDKASRLQPGGSQQPKPNVDLDAPIFAFQVDGSKPTVLTTIPFYQDPEKARIYRGELSATFNDDMRGDEFSDRTFIVKDLLSNAEVVGGFVSYAPALRKAIFVPIVPFQPNGFYRVEVKTDAEGPAGADGKPTLIKGVHDLAGNPLDNEFSFTFRTADTPFEETWNITLRASDGASTDANNIVGLAFGALDAEDTQDARAVPSLSSQMSLSFLNRAKEAFDRDLRPADGRLEHHWFFVIDNPKDGSKVQIFWLPSIKLRRVERQYQLLRLIEFDASGKVSNAISLDPIGLPKDAEGSVKEALAYEYTVARGETSRHFRLDVMKAALVATKLEKGSSGWKFLSAPIIPQRADPFVNLGDDIDDLKLYQYDTKLNGYKIYPLDLGEVALIAGKSYFTRLKQTVEVDVGGAPSLETKVLELKDAGWHAIGNPFTVSVNVADLKFNEVGFSQAVADGLTEDTLYRWKATAQTGAVDLYEAVKADGKLEPWEGYWLRTKKADLKLTIPSPLGLANFIAPLPASYQPPLAPPLTATAKLTSGQFELRLALTSALASDLLTTLGAKTEAKLGFDAFDSSEPPTLSGTVAAYFEHNDWSEQPGLYNSDYQPPLETGQERHWQFVVYNDNTANPDLSANAKLRLSWEEAIDNLPLDTMFYFRPIRQLDARTGSEEGGSWDSDWQDWQDMRQVRFVELKANGRITKLRFEIKAMRFELTLPEAVAVTAGEKQVKISWKANKAKPNSFIESYTIEKWKLGDGIKVKMEMEMEMEMVGQASSPVGEGESPTTEPTAPMAQYSIRPQLLAETDGSGYEFVDTEVEEEANYAYQLSVHFKTGAALKSQLFFVKVQPVIKSTRLLQNYPNPFNPETWIPYELKQDAKVSIRIYNVNGQVVRSLDLGYQTKGRYSSRQKAAYWDGRNAYGERAASGVYFYVIQAGKFVAAKKMVVVK